MGIFGVIVGLIGVINLLTKSPMLCYGSSALFKEILQKLLELEPT